MEGFNWWGAFTFVMPIALVIIIGVIAIITSILDVVNKLRMKELREKLHKTIDEYGRTDERTVAISQELDKLVCEAQKLIIKKGLSYIEAIEKAKELIGSERVALM